MAEAEATGGRTRVLIMDDQPDIVSLLRIIAQVDGRFEVVGTATEGAGAIELSRHLHPDVLILDHLVDDGQRQPSGGRAMSGREAIATLRQLLPDALIVMYTGVSPGADVPSDADLYVVKGEVDPAAMFELVATALRSRE